MGVGVTGLNATGYAVNILDIAPKYAGVIIGISNVFGSMPGFISPQIVGYITTKNVSTIHTLTVLSYHYYYYHYYNIIIYCSLSISYVVFVSVLFLLYSLSRIVFSC